MFRDTSEIFTIRGNTLRPCMAFINVQNTFEQPKPSVLWLWGQSRKLDNNKNRSVYLAGHWLGYLVVGCTGMARFGLAVGCTWAIKLGSGSD